MSREEDDAVALVRVYCGLASADLAEPQSGSDIWLTVAVVDDAGRLIDICEVSDDAGGYAELSALLAQRSGGTSAVAVAAESDDHVVTQLLTAAGRNLAFTDDDSADDYAERFADDESPEEIQSNAAERRAVGLARALQAGVLSAVGQSPPRDMLPLKPVLAAHAAVVSGRQSAAATLREVLRELYPAALRAYPDPAETIPLAVLDALPEPGILGGGATGRKGDQVVIGELAKAGVADAATLGEAITALRVAIAETPRRTGVNRAMTAAVAETIRQSVAAVRAGDAAAAALVAVLAEKMSPAAHRTLPNRQRPATPLSPAAPLNQPAQPLTPATPLRPATALPESSPSRSRAAAVASNARPAAAASDAMPTRTRASRAAESAGRVAETAARAAEVARAEESAAARATGGRRRAQTTPNMPLQAQPPVVSAPPAASLPGTIGSAPAVVSGPPAVISAPPVVSTPPGYVPSAPPAYGSVPSAPPAYGSVPSAPPAYGSVPSGPPAYGSVPSGPPAYGVTSAPPGYAPASHAAPTPPYQPAAYQAPTPMYAPAPPVPPTYQGQQPTPASMQSIPVPLQPAPPQPTPVAPLPVAPAPVAPPPVAPSPVIPPQPTSTNNEPQFTSLMPSPPPGIAPLIGGHEHHEMPRFDSYGFDPLAGMPPAPPITPAAPTSGGGLDGGPRLSDLSALGEPPTLSRWAQGSADAPTTETSAAAYKFGADPLASASELSSLPKLSDIPQPPDFSALDATIESTSGSLSASGTPRREPRTSAASSASSSSSSTDAFGSRSSATDALGSRSSAADALGSRSAASDALSSFGSGEFPPLNGDRSTRSRAESGAAAASAGLSRAERRAERDRAEQAAAEQARGGSRHADRAQDEEPARSERARTEIPRTSRTEIPRTESPRSELPRTEVSRTEIPRTEIPRSERARTEIPRSDRGRTEIPRSERSRTAERHVELPRQREGRVPPPWQTGELPVEPAGLRLVEPAPVADPALRGGYSDELSGEYSGEFRFEPPALRLVDSERPAERATARSTGAGRSRRAQAAERDAAPKQPDEGDGDLLIFAAARSAWFTDWDADEATGETQAPNPSWENSNDQAWQAAQRAAAPQIGDETSTGLPRRVPQQNLVPGAPVNANPERPLRIVRDAAQIAAHTTGYFRGWRRGQEVGGFSVGGRPGRESAGGWDFSREASRDYQEREYEYRSARR
ncbi:hypothetical protein [Dactylosporangium sp. CS-033363]|uniref:hypothetical protein n=1 Tax=Dactylosporangium sp. CS-033363 TaxID=3239935 RepID=UPI003D8A7165